MTGLLLATSCTAVAHAEGAADTSVAPVANTVPQGDIVVTAEHHKSALQTTPLAISVISGNALDKMNAQDITDLNGSVPSLVVTKTGGRETVPTIRGIGSGTPENSGSTAPGVSMFVDGVYIGDSLSLGQSFFDLDQIEVLRGPQGALYGVSSIGGALILNSKQPTLDKISGNADISLGNYNYVQARGAVNIPLSDTVAVRLSGQRLYHDGFTTNTVNPGYKLDDANQTALKGSVLWQPIDNFSATLTYQWSHKHEHGPAQKGLDDPNTDPRVVSQDYLSKDDYNSNLVHLNLKWDLPAFTITSVSAYRYYDSQFAENVTYSTLAQYGSYEDVPTWNHENKTLSQEFDILSHKDSKLDWTAGIFLMRSIAEDYTLEYYGTNVNDAMPTYVNPTGYEPDMPSNLAYGNQSRDVRTVVEPFVQFSYPILDHLKLTAGARYNYEKHDHSSLNFAYKSLVGTQPPYYGSTSYLTDETKVPTWRAELAYDLTRNNMIYASASTGYKAGGANGNANNNPLPQVVPNIFKAEHNTAFEVGSKNYFFDHTLRLNVAAYYYIYKNMQYIETDPIPYDQGMSNIPLVHEWGGEAELSYNGMSNRLHLNANISLADGKVIGNTYVIDSTVTNASYGNAACAYSGQYYNPACWAAVEANAKNIKGARPPGLAKLSGSFDASYDFAAPGGTLTPWIQFLRQGQRESRIFNEPVLDNEPAYNLLNMSVTYLPTRSRLRFTFSVSNVANSNAINSRYTSPYEQGLTSEQFVAPRQFIGTIGYTF